MSAFTVFQSLEGRNPGPAELGPLAQGCSQAAVKVSAETSVLSRPLAEVGEDPPEAAGGSQAPHRRLQSLAKRACP